MDAAEFRKAIQEALGTLNPAVEAALRRELAGPIDLGHSGRLQFEVCPYFHGIHCKGPPKPFRQVGGGANRSFSSRRPIRTTPQS
jgi:hypothetical protein